MNWSSAAEFLAMGGYGGYVWGSFGITAACIALEVILVRGRQRAALRAVQSRALAQ